MFPSPYKNKYGLFEFLFERVQIPLINQQFEECSNCLPLKEKYRAEAVKGQTEEAHGVDGMLVEQNLDGCHGVIISCTSFIPNAMLTSLS